MVGIGYGVKNYGESGKEFLLSADLTTAAYCLAREYSRGEKSQRKYGDVLFYAKEDFNVKAPDLSESHIITALNKVIAWAQAQDIEKKLCEEATNHSAVAQALLGDMEALRSDRSTPKLSVPEFADYKTMTSDDRLLFFAQAYKNGGVNDILTRKKTKQRSISLTAAMRVLKTQGWFSTEPGKMWLILPDRFIQFDFGFIRLHDNYNVRIEAEISNEMISVACNCIHYSEEYWCVSPTGLYNSFNTIGGGFLVVLVKALIFV
ncbi:hypothetical protein GGR08_001729 [Bartonella fuyuanensis]|uniref:Uncharacterized protein n=1 Tax=Bartonella fuyuanensis TaxID=1460968 RepID=A0A840E5K1_9HYPH|nr:hypothetical protein [Bartonella fuyuanensis]